MEEWRLIEDFPNYEVSNEGRVRNESTQYLLGQYENGHGFLQVVLRRDGKNWARAVHKLVADTFVDVEFSDFRGNGYSPIHIDYNRFNNCADNLEWRPRWYANKRTRQHNRAEPLDYRPVRIIETGEEYETALDCARAIDGLEELILSTIMQGPHASYLRRHFEFA